MDSYGNVMFNAKTKETINEKEGALRKRRIFSLSLSLFGMISLVVVCVYFLSSSKLVNFLSGIALSVFSIVVLLLGIMSYFIFVLSYSNYLIVYENGISLPDISAIGGWNIIKSSIKKTLSFYISFTDIQEIHIYKNIELIGIFTKDGRKHSIFFHDISADKSEKTTNDFIASITKPGISIIYEKTNGEVKES